MEQHTKAVKAMGERLQLSENLLEEREFIKLSRFCGRLWLPACT
jgi:hypothetical protein